MKVAVEADRSSRLTLLEPTHMTGEGPAQRIGPCEKTIQVSEKKLPKHYSSVVYLSDDAAVGEGWGQCDARRLAKVVRKTLARWT